jgi:hypothetical protein
MRLIVIFLLLVFLAGYLGVLPEASYIKNLPVQLVFGAIFTLCVVFVLSRVEPR